MNNLKKVETTKDIKELTKEELIDLQKALYDLGYTEIWIDGIYGKQTKQIYNKFKEDNDLSYPDLIGLTTITFLLGKLIGLEKKDDSGFKILKTPEEINGKKMVVKVPDNWVQRKLSTEDLVKLASLFNLSIPTIRAVLEVESSGSGFLLNELAPCRPKILFEGHIFYTKTKNRDVAKIRPDLSYSRWTTKYYKGGSAEWERLLDAINFDYRAALLSASWGLGQVMGFNYSTLGYSTVEEMVTDAHKDEYHQVKQMLFFCKNHPSQKLLPSLRTQDWRTFAYYYNGEGYRKNKYDIKLKQAYQKFSRT